jgi:hypothetical protein
VEAISQHYEEWEAAELGFSMADRLTVPGFDVLNRAGRAAWQAGRQGGRQGGREHGRQRGMETGRRCECDHQQ